MPKLQTNAYPRRRPFRFFEDQVTTSLLSVSKSTGAVLTRCRMIKYQMNPKPHKKNATTANTTTGLKAMPNTREPFNRHFEQSIAAHRAVSNPKRKLAPIVNMPASKKLTINHATAGTTTCGGQPVLDGERDDSGDSEGEVISSNGC